MRKFSFEEVRMAVFKHELPESFENNPVILHGILTALGWKEEDYLSELIGSIDRNWEIPDIKIWN